MFEIFKRVKIDPNNIEYNFTSTSNGMWVEPIKINDISIEIRNYGLVLPKGYKLGFTVDGVLLTFTMTASSKFKKITGTDTFEEPVKLLNIYGNYMIQRYKRKIFK